MNNKYLCVYNVHLKYTYTVFSGFKCMFTNKRILTVAFSLSIHFSCETLIYYTHSHCVLNYPLHSTHHGKYHSNLGKHSSSVLNNCGFIFWKIQYAYQINYYMHNFDK